MPKPTAARRGCYISFRGADDREPVAIFLRRHVPDFIQLVAPRWNRERILQTMRIEEAAVPPRSS
jgi:hypothetical protein